MGLENEIVDGPAADATTISFSWLVRFPAKRKSLLRIKVGLGKVRGRIRVDQVIIMYACPLRFGFGLDWTGVDLGYSEGRCD